MRSSTFISVLASLGLTVSATPLPEPLGLESRQVYNGINYTQLVDGFFKSFVGSTRSGLAAGGFGGFVAAFDAIKPMSPPTSIDDAAARLQAAGTKAKTEPSTSIYDYATLLRALNLSDSAGSLVSYASGFATGMNSMSNVNRPPAQPIYPKKEATDAPYSVSEQTLRSAIYIPPGFTYGKSNKTPVVLLPGTGNTGYITFKGNYIKLLQASDFADPVWVNMPGYDLGDAQISAEYVAYAVNYIASVTGKNVTALGWSQGALNTQWALKYWPSTRKVTSDFVAVSPDYKGTIAASFIGPNGSPLPPSVYQQRYLADSKFITTLRKGDGDSAFVPTTNVYSGFFDEIVQPQAGGSPASGYLNDAKKVGVTNNEVQLICGGKPGGSFYSHESMLVNPLGYALLRDAMKNDGPGKKERLDLNSVCSTYLTPGLNMGDFLLTENTILVSGLGIIAYQPKATTEPPIMAYAA